MADQDDCDYGLSANGVADADGMVRYPIQLEKFNDAGRGNFRGAAGDCVLDGGAAARRDEANAISRAAVSRNGATDYDVGVMSVRVPRRERSLGDVCFMTLPRLTSSLRSLDRSSSSTSTTSKARA